MGLFGGGNSSSSTTTTTQNAGFSQVGGSALALQGSGNRITLTDKNALDTAQNIASQALHQVEVASSNGSSIASQAISSISAAAQSDTQSIALTALKWGALAFVAYMAFKAFGKR